MWDQEKSRRTSKIWGLLVRLSSKKKFQVLPLDRDDGILVRWSQAKRFLVGRTWCAKSAAFWDSHCSQELPKECFRVIFALDLKDQAAYNTLHDWITGSMRDGHHVIWTNVSVTTFMCTCIMVNKVMTILWPPKSNGCPKVTATWK